MQILLLLLIKLLQLVVLSNFECIKIVLPLLNVGKSIANNVWYLIEF